MMSPSSPLSCSLADFLCEADGPSLWLHQHFDDYIADIDTSFEPEDVADLPKNAHYGVTLSNDGASALLLHRTHATAPWTTDAEMVGYYNTPGAVCLQDAHQGQGLGAELILWTALNLSGGAPTAGLDEQCFTEAGFAAHQAAWRLGVARGLINDPDVPSPTVVRRRRSP